MPSKRQEEFLRKQKYEALFALLHALMDGKIPKKTRGLPPSERYLTTGNIIERLDDQYQHITKRAMLQALLDVEVPHDDNNRFTVWRLHAYRDKMIQQLVEYDEALSAGQKKSVPKASPHPTFKPDFARVREYARRQLEEAN